MIALILGTIGSGKTLLLTLFTYLYYLDNSKLYTNYNIKGVNTISLDNIKQFNDIEKEKNFFGLDEMWLNMDARRSGSFTNMLITQHLLQSRKKLADVMITSQTINQIDKRIRDIAHIIFFPEVSAKDSKGMPIELKVTMYPLHQKWNVKKFYTPLILGNVIIPEIYDTTEIIEVMEGGKSGYLEDLSVKYKDCPLKTKKAMKAFIRREEGSEGNNITDGDLDNVIEYIYIKREYNIS